MDLRPSVNDPVVLRAGDGREYRSRVEDAAPGSLTVARPLELRAAWDAESPDVLVTWICSRGVAVLPTRIAEVRTEGSVRLWSLAVTGDGWIEQHRRFVRVPATGRMTLRLRDDEKGFGTVLAHLVDVSEAAIRCAVDPEAAQDLVDDEVEVIASFQLGHRDFAVPARVASQREVTQRDQLAEVVVVFDEPNRDADALRREIFAQQLRAARARDDDR